MRICVIGSGYVGLVTSACFADFGNTVVGVDIDPGKIKLLNKGKAPFYEPGLDDLIKNNIKDGRLVFTTDLKKVINDCDIIFICVGTPTHRDGSIDLSYVEQAARDIGDSINCYKIIVTKSTVPVGTSKMIFRIIGEVLTKRKKKIKFEVVSNPEFLREGAAVFDATHPNRIIVGTESTEVRQIMSELYRPLYLLGTPMVFTNCQTAELAKYAANAFLATKISFINEIANVCEIVGAEVKDIAKAMSYDNRIGGKFLHSGIGYGGSCFPKDTRGLVYQSGLAGYDMKIVAAAIKVNEEQVKRFCCKITCQLGKISHKTIGILGLSFKPNTDDIREAPALAVIDFLQREKALVKVFDPIAMPGARKSLKGVTFCRDAYQTAKGCDALLIITEWNEFRNLDLSRIKKLLKKPVIIDGRNIYNPGEMKKLGFNYTGVGRG
ncbi:MAG: UDP-glucose/GDP-mannose dehydrogenase family protein [bacterium]|nr:UDP-glucose/GDP-mannose dehydrogenase family protein [bacterium]